MATIRQPQLRGAYSTVGTGGHYATVSAARLDSVFAIQFISDITESVDIVYPDNQDVLILVNGFTWNTEDVNVTVGGTARLKISGPGKIASTLTTSSKRIFTINDTATFDHHNLIIDGTANTGNNTGIASLSSSALSIGSNLDISLHNGTGSGYINYANGSLLSDIIVRGGGSSCSGLIAIGDDCVLSSIVFKGTFNTSSSPGIIGITTNFGTAMSDFQNDSSSSDLFVTISGSNHQVTNFSGMSIDLGSSVTSNISNCTLQILDMTNASCSLINISNCVINDTVTIAGTQNSFTSTSFNSNLTVNGSTNIFNGVVMDATANMIVSGDNNRANGCNLNANLTFNGGADNNKFLFTRVAVTLTDSGSGNEISDTATIPAPTNLSFVDLTTTPESLGTFAPGERWQFTLTAPNGDIGMFIHTSGFDAVGNVMIVNAFALGWGVVESPTGTYALTLINFATVYEVVINQTTGVATVATQSGTATGTTTVKVTKIA